MDRLNGEVENIPAGELCDFPVRVRQKYLRDKTSVWDGTIADIDRRSASS